MQSYSFPDVVCRLVGLNQRPHSYLLKLALLLLCVMSTALLHAETISGRVVDPSGAVIVGARVEITGGELTQPIVLSSDAQGNSPPLT